MYSSSDFCQGHHRDEQRTVGLQKPPSDDYLTKINCEKIKNRPN
jgi:hypothetical protein